MRDWLPGCLSVVLSISAATAASAQIPETVLLNGKILTVDQQFSTRSAVAIREARIGVGDPGGNNVTPREYQALFKVWREGHLTVRVAYSLCGMTDGSEFDEYRNYLAMMPQGFGDEMLHFNGIGERITWAMNGINGIPPEADQEKYYQIVRWAAERGLTVTMHWNSDANVEHLLGIWGRFA